MARESLQHVVVCRGVIGKAAADSNRYFEAESPRGQLGFYIESDGSAIPYRLKVRGPCFCNLSILAELCREVPLADVPAIIGSIDVVMGEVDR